MWVNRSFAFQDELFEKARGEILDEIINLSHVTPQQWEDAFHRKLWQQTSAHVLESIYLPASQASNPGLESSYPPVYGTTCTIHLHHLASCLQCVQHNGRHQAALLGRQETAEEMCGGWHADAAGALEFYQTLFIINLTYIVVCFRLLQEQFSLLLNPKDAKHKKEEEDIFAQLKRAVLDESMQKHNWDPKAETSLVSAHVL